jgi:hypothetical protein
LVVDLEESSSSHTRISITPSLQSDTAGGDFLVDFPTSREEFIEHRGETVNFPTLTDKRNTTTRQKTQSVDEADARRPWRKYKPPPPPKKVPIVESLMNEDTTTPSTLFDHPPETVNYLDTLDSDQLYREDLDQYEHIGFAFEDEYDTIASHFPMNQDVMTSSDISVNNLNDDTSVLTDLRLAQTALGWNEDDVKSQRSTQIQKNIEPMNYDSDDDDPIQLPNTPIIVDLKYGVERRLAAIRARQKMSTTSSLQEEGKHTSVLNKPDESKRRRRRHRPRKHLVTNSNDDKEGDDELQPYRHRNRSKSQAQANQAKDRHHRSRSQRQKSQRDERQDQPQEENENRHRSGSRRRKRIPIENEIQEEGERRYSQRQDQIYSGEEKNHLLTHDGDYSDEEALPTAVLGDDSDEEAEGRDTFDEEKGPLHIGKRANTGSLKDGLESDLQVTSSDNLENFRNVFMQAEKKKGNELSFHGLWNSKVESGSDHGSDLSQASQKSARFQQVKVTMRAKGFGLKMQRIFGPRLWAIKFYILVAFFLLLLILVIVIPLAIRKGKKPDLGTLAPSTTPTIAPSKRIGYIEITSFIGENANDGAGSSLAIASDTNIIAIGLPNGASGVGEVRVFTLVDKQLLPYGKSLKGKNKGDMFGNSLSISMDGQILAVGSPMANRNQGYVAVFEFNYERQDWVKMGQDITLSEEDTFVGSAISLSGNGNRLAIGIPRASGDNGQTLIFQFSSSTGIWIRLGSTLYGSRRELHGFAVSLDGTGKTLAVGAVRSSTSTPNSGRVYLYRWDTTTWVPFGSTIFGNDLMGRSVSLSLDGMRVAIGSTGYDKGNLENVGACAVYGYLGDWVQLGSTLQGNTAEEKSGQSVVISADGLRVACGSAGGSIVRIYQEGESDWELVGNQPLVSESKQQPESNFGAAIAMNSNGSLLVIGAPKERVKDEENAGAVRVFLEL